MKNSIYTILAIIACLALGKLIHYAVGGLPASLYGMIFYCLLFQLNFLSPSKVHQANHWAVKNMGICFIPAAVGVINHFELIKSHGFAIIFIIVCTTFLLLTFVGLYAQKYLTTLSTSASTLSST